MHEQYDSSNDESNRKGSALEGEILGVERGKIKLIEIPHYKLRSPNKPEHWTARKKRVDKEHELLKLFVRPWIQDLRLPIKLTLMRISPRKFDAEDNFRIAFKNIKDGLAKLFFPESRMGMADELDCFKWEYEQIKGKAKEYRIFVRIQEI